MKRLSRSRVHLSFAVFALSVVCLIAYLIPLVASTQDAAASPAPRDVLLQLKTEGDRHVFRLGEAIPITLTYTTTTPGKYTYVSDARKLGGGRGPEFTCSPAAERADVSRFRPKDFETFHSMLYARCGHGSGGGFGGVSGGYETVLNDVPLSFGTTHLNRVLRFRGVGTYACVTSAVQITTAPSDAKIRPGLLLTSNPLTLRIVKDPAWAQAAIREYDEAYAASCRGDDVWRNDTSRCFDISGRITYLDTLDSLSVEVKYFDGRSHGWDNGFWDAIQRSSYPRQALRLMAARIQEPDFEVTRNVLELLAMWELKLDLGDRFETASPRIYHDKTLQKLRKYVRLVGSSLPRKNQRVRGETARTYARAAEDEYCDEQPLIPSAERNRMLRAVGDIVPASR